jgi:hypothetical protein
MSTQEAAMRNRRFSAAGNEKARQDQIQIVRELADRAGYEGDRAYNAAQELLGDGRHWSSSPERADTLIAALRAKLGE